MPPGACTSAVSPSVLPISARAIGELTEILLALMSASSSPTIWYAVRSPLVEVRELHGRAEHDAAVGLDRGGIDDLRVRELRFDFGRSAPR